jgi:hypothetical protein
METLQHDKIFHDVAWNILPNVLWIGMGFIE